jgi:CSLREA domain-containing protein
MLEALLPAALLLLPAVPAQAATFNVNSLADGTDASIGDGVCETSGGSGNCTLRAAVQSAPTPAADDIVLGPGVHSVSTFVSAINNDVTIRGAGARATTIAGSVGGGGVLLLSNSDAQIRDLRIAGGSAAGIGGGLTVGGTGSVIVERVTVAGNEVVSSGNSGSGGGISKNGTGSLTIRSSTVRGNSATTTNPGPTTLPPAVVFPYGRDAHGCQHDDSRAAQRPATSARAPMEAGCTRVTGRRLCAMSPWRVTRWQVPARTGATSPPTSPVS